MWFEHPATQAYYCLTCYIVLIAGATAGQKIGLLYTSSIISLLSKSNVIQAVEALPNISMIYSLSLIQAMKWWRMKLDLIADSDRPYPSLGPWKVNLPPPPRNPTGKAYAQISEFSGISLCVVYVLAVTLRNVSSVFLLFFVCCLCTYLNRISPIDFFPFSKRKPSNLCKNSCWRASSHILYTLAPKSLVSLLSWHQRLYHLL